MYEYPTAAAKTYDPLSSAHSAVAWVMKWDLNQCDFNWPRHHQQLRGKGRCGGVLSALASEMTCLGTNAFKGQLAIVHNRLVM